MPKIINVPIEPLEERYSQQWAKWWPREFNKLDLTYHSVPGKTLTNTIEQGAFLDVIGTNYYKASQLQYIMQALYNGKIEDGDTFLFHDLWFPGMEMLAYVRDALKLKFNITGILHAGTYDPHDYISKAGMERWGAKQEESWFQFVDEIYVATEFHKRMICKNRVVSSLKIKVTGLPIFPEFDLGDINQPESFSKKDWVVFPHRLDKEKNPDTFDALDLAVTRDGDSPICFFKTKDYWTNKGDYFRQLLQSKVAVSCADQETWGIAMQESVFAGCIPLVPDRLSYQEMYLPEFRYRSNNEMYNLCMEYLLNYDHPNVQALLTKQKTMLREAGSLAIPNIVNHIGLLAPTYTYGGNCGR